MTITNAPRLTWTCSWICAWLTARMVLGVWRSPFISVFVGSNSFLLCSRLTGAGWGGCAVALVPESKSEAFMKAIEESFYSSRVCCSVCCCRCIAGPCSCVSLFCVRAAPRRDFHSTVFLQARWWRCCLHSQVDVCSHSLPSPPSIRVAPSLQPPNNCNHPLP